MNPAAVDAKVTDEPSEPSHAVSWVSTLSDVEPLSTYSSN